MNTVKSMLRIHDHPLLNVMAGITRLKVVRTSSKESEKRLQFSILDQDNKPFLYAQGDSFCCLRLRYMRVEIRNKDGDRMLRIKRNCTLETACCYDVLCPDSGPIRLYGDDGQQELGKVKENCSTLMAAYSYENEANIVMAHLEGPLILSGLVGLGCLFWFQPRVNFKLLSKNGNVIGTLTRQLGLVAPDHYDIEFVDFFMSPQLKLMVLCSTFLLENRYFEDSTCDLFNCYNYLTWG